MKKIFIGLLSFLVVVFIITLFLPSEVEVKRDVIIEASPKTIFNQVNRLPNWKKWSVWDNIDRDMYSRYEGEEGEGATHFWESENPEVGIGSLKIISSIPYGSIKTQLEFKDQGTGNGFWEFEQMNNGTKVTWGFKIDMGSNPIAKIVGLFMNDKLGASFDSSLAHLKKITEKMPEKALIIADQIEIEEMWFLSIVKEVSPAEMNSVHETGYGQISTFMDEKGFKQTEAPLAIYHVMSDTLIKIELGIPVKDSIPGNELINCVRLKSGMAVRTAHYGKYESLPATYMLFNDWIRQNNIIVTGPPWEVYVTDPSEEPDVSKWETHIFFPID